MAQTSKQDLIKTATDMGIPLTGEETGENLKELIESHVGNSFSESANTKPARSEKMIPMSDVRKLIAEEVAKMRSAEDEQKGVKKVKRVQEHHVSIKRWDARWVVDFVDQNKDPYLKVPVHAFNIWNEQKKQDVAHLELVLLNEETGEKTTAVVPLTRYLERRLSVYCLIIKRHKVDASYSIGEVEIKKDKGDGMMRGTGVYRDQEVIMDNEVFEVKMPTGNILKFPDYVVC